MNKACKEIKMLRDEYPNKVRAWGTDDAEKWFETQVKNLITARDDRLVERIEGIKDNSGLPTQTEWGSGFVDGFNKALDKAIQLIREGEDGK